MKWRIIDLTQDILTESPSTRPSAYRRLPRQNARGNRLRLPGLALAGHTSTSKFS